MKRTIIALAALVYASTHLPAYSSTPDDKGFRHPGGLHTQADFDRIKQQLEDGDATVTAAYQVLCNADYAQSTAATYAVETIYRGSTENYINAARGATIAYQNALRWKIDGNTACAKHAVDVLMTWARTTTGISGTSDQCLAAGLYGYEFAQAAELMRDYEGWDEDDFAEFQQWMLDLWYPKAIGFLRVRNGTWQNSSAWWQAPGHYWSNWGLCNALCVISIGVLCDDVYIYNQGMSFFKYDQVGTFVDPRVANPILNDGLTEFLGNLVVTTADRDGAPYGKVGQMNESGRDVGHASMALGLAVDIAHQGYNQGDDLFSYMDYRLAAGIEYVAAQMLSVSDLPWTNYHYATNGYYWTDSRAWLMTEPCLGESIRCYWGTVIGHYEGVKGVTMPYSERCLAKMGIDGGGAGSTSGGYDHLGYSVLLNTRDGIAPADSVPTLLTPYISYNGKTLQQAELGGLTNTYTNSGTSAIANGLDVTLWAELPDGEEDTGLWQWNTGQTTQSITVSTDQSYAYRVTYTNARGAQSERLFTIAAEGDCRPLTLSPYAQVSGGEVKYSTNISVPYNKSVALTLDVAGSDWCQWLWDNNKTTQTRTVSLVRRDSVVTGYVVNHGGLKQQVNYYLWLALDEEAEARLLPVGNYKISFRPDGKLLTNNGVGSTPTFEDEDPDNALGQTWYIYRSSEKYPYYELRSLIDDSSLKVSGQMIAKQYNRPLRITFAEGLDYACIYTSSGDYFTVDHTGTIDFAGEQECYGYPFLIQAAEQTSRRADVQTSAQADEVYDLMGRRVTAPTKGIYIVGGKKTVVR